ncbi:MAG: hypothetical protein HY901_06155 [Deltaproteobacteria bacterium]|nr:hypothetical protein [Deltaproteobacteria bacterium]
MRFTLTAAALAVLLLPACSCDSSGPLSATECAPGTLVRCVCADTREGEALCGVDGRGFEECVCPTPCVPASVLACDCDGGSGLTHCAADGSGYGDCICPAACVPGTLAACVCESGREGLATCEDDGSRFGPCGCAKPVCEPQSVLACQCPDGIESQASCYSDGSGYGACQCSSQGTCEAPMPCKCPFELEGWAACSLDGTLLDCRCDVELCVPGNLALCQCDSGHQGQQRCNAKGSAFEACQCSSRACNPGTLAACTCDGGGEGFATCLPSGEAFNECWCELNACVPGTEKVCVCQTEQGSVFTGVATCDAAGQSWGTCDCSPPCGTLQAHGTLHTSKAEVDLFGMPTNVLLRHRADADASEDGCVSHAWFSTGSKGVGCQLELDFTPAMQGCGGLSTLKFTADQYCPGFDHASQGTYHGTGAYFPMWFTGPTRVPDRLAQVVCLRDVAVGFPNRPIALHRDDGTKLEVNLGSLQFLGSSLSIVSIEHSCVDRLECDERTHDDGEGWCTALGSCAPGFHDSGEGQCLNGSECAPGFQLGGSGRCVRTSCPSGYHDGGSQECVLERTCSVGYELGWDDLTCIWNGCAAGEHSGGTSECVPLGMCVPPYHDNGWGRCVPDGCANGFHDDGTGSCVAQGCAPGHHDGGQGACVAMGTCLDGYRDDGTGRCVAGACAAGFHDGGAQHCTPIGECWPGYGFDRNGYCFQWTSTTYPATVRGSSVLIPLLNGKVLAIGSNTAEVYDPTSERWSPTGAVGQNVVARAAARLPDGRALVLTGIGRSTLLYDPASNAWSPGAPTSYSRPNQSACFATLTNGQVLVAGSDQSSVKEIEVYDPAAQTWSTLGQLSIAQKSPVCVRLANGKVLVAGGETTGGSWSRFTSELVDPSTGLSSLVGSLRDPIKSALLLADGRVLAIGSQNQLFDPASGTWRLQPSHYCNWSGLAALAELPSGRVLAIGQSSWSADAKVFDPALDSWECIDPLLFPTANASMVTLSNGRVLVLGNDPPAELYIGTR